MGVSLFSYRSPGQLVRIDGNDHSFVPSDLPPRWQMNENIWPLLLEATNEIALLEGIGRTLPNPEILLRPTADREAIRSSKLEGTIATPRQLFLFELDPVTPTSESDPLNDHLEVFNYQRALKHGNNSDLPISLRLIRELHATLLQNVRGQDKAPGEFRRIQVAIGTDRRFIPPPPHMLLHCLDVMEKYIHSKSPFHPLIDCFLVHYQFEAIHPFIDGNGRIGRLLLALMITRACRLTKCWLYLSEYFDNHRSEYMQRLFEVSTEARWAEWVKFCLEATIHQARATVNRCERLRKVREEFTIRVNAIGGNVRLSQIVEEIFHHPFLTVAALPAKYDVSYPTAKADVDKLVAAGVLQELAGTKIKTYYAPEVFRVAYEELDFEQDASDPNNGRTDVI